MKRVLVTGASGLCGRPVVRELIASGHAVRALVRRIPATQLANVEFVTGDLSDAIDWPPVLEGVDAVVHQAAVTAGDRIAEAEYERINHRATDDLARAAQAAGVGHFLFVSSVSAQSGPAAALRLS
jgi:UDP-glucose 4-epimerase